MSGTYTLTVTDGNGCTGNATTNVVVKAKPVANPSSNTPVCAGETIELYGDAGVDSWSWTGPLGFTSSLQNPTRAGATTGMSGDYYLTVTDDGCDSDAVATNVVVKAKPVVTTNDATNVTSESATLNGNLTDLGTASSVQVSFLWGLTTSYGNETTPQTMSATGPFSGNLTGLTPDTTYHFRAKAVGYCFAYGADMTFNTGNLQPPNRPSNVSPANGADCVSMTPTLISSAFSDPDPGDTHATSQWQVTTTPGNYTSPIFDSGVDTIHLTSITIPSGLLDNPTTYYWHVAHQDGNGTWSSWSVETSFTTAIHLRLSGWGLCTSYGSVVEVVLEGCVIMVERAHAPPGYSIHWLGNLTLDVPGGPHEVIDLEMYGSRERSLFYLSQEVTGKSVNLAGAWEDAADNQYYIMTEGWIMLPSLQGSAMKTGRTCYVLLRTPEVEPPIKDPGSFVDDLESMLTRLVKFLDMVLDALIGTGFGTTLGAIWAKILVLLGALRQLGTPFVP